MSATKQKAAKRRAIERSVEFSDEQRRIVYFCAVECEMQRSGEQSVSWMLNGWQYALQQRKDWPNVGDVLNLGSIVEPEKNEGGFRRVPVRIGWDVLDAWSVIPQQIESLCSAVVTLTPGEWFYEYEKVHPFVDGNGRTGQILFNWLNDSLGLPQWAPNFFDDERRVAGRGAPHPSFGQQGDSE